MVVAAFSSTQFKSDLSSVVSHQEVTEYDLANAWGTADLSNLAGECLGVGEGLAL